MVSTKRQRSKNERLVSAKVDLVRYYNDIVPILLQHSKRPFREMTVNDNTGLCPFHDDNDPSFHHWRGKQLFHCFGCQFTGDVVSSHRRFLREYMQMSVTHEEVTKMLAEQYGIELDDEEGFALESPFERAKKLLFNPSSFKLPKGQFTLTDYRRNNKRVREANLNEIQVVETYAHLDLVASLHLSMQKESELV